MKKGIAIGIGIAVAIAIAGILGFNTYMVKESQKPSPVENNLPTAPPSSHGRNLSINLTESVNVNAH